MLEIDLASATKNIGFHNGTWQIYVPRDFANSEAALVDSREQSASRTSRTTISG